MTKTLKSYKSIGGIKAYLLRTRPHQCQLCKNTEWPIDDPIAPIALVVHYLDGNKKNITEDNLVLWCKNCHKHS